jgi:predicted CXXCH cytochrome family protein
MILKILIQTAAALSIVAHVFAAAPSTVSGEDINQYCFSCHAKKGSIKKFAEGESISVYVNPQAYEKSVHKKLSCTVCHNEFSDKKHPDRLFRNKYQYSIKESQKCLQCHAEGSLKSRPVHEQIFAKGKSGGAVVCTNCHSAHAATRISGGGIAASEEAYCMKCHKTENIMKFATGKIVSTKVNTESLKSSAHRNLGCSDCHFNFSAEDHPKRRFRSEREYRIASFEMCRRCHFDKYSQVSNSIHYAMISSGRLNAPTCVDCHGSHEISPARKSKISTVRMCEKCHHQPYESYVKSVHGSKLLTRNIKDTPVCIDCHSSHDIKAISTSDFHDNIPQKCGSCHADKKLMSKYGLSTDVFKTYLSDFHGLTLELRKKERRNIGKQTSQMAVCTDCHGSHEIMPFSGADTQVIKSRLLKRCQTCHADAPENFSDAWLSHYSATLAATPVLFIVGWFYKILLWVIVAGVLFQIALDIWRHIQNR